MRSHYRNPFLFDTFRKCFIDSDDTPFESSKVEIKEFEVIHSIVQMFVEFRGMIGEIQCTFIIK